MQRRELGRGGFEIGEVGLGCWQFGGGFGPMADRTAQAIMDAAAAWGIDFFDTADVYGAGRSERLIADFRQRRGQPITVATKFGRGEVFPDGYTEDAMRRAIAGSAERLGVESLDLLQLHCVPTDVLRDRAIFDWLRRAKDDGLIRHFGASVETEEEGLICLEQEGLLSLQVIFNIFRQKLLDRLLPEAKRRGVGIIVRLPLASGLLAGKFTAQTAFDPSDHRHFNRDGQRFNVGETFAGLPFETGVELAEKLRPWVPENMTMAQMALRWLLDQDAVSVVIPGASSPEQAEANAAASDLPPLPAELHARLAAFYKDEVHDHIRGPY